MTPNSILLVRLSALGDVIHVLPSLRELRAAYPQAKIGWAVEEAAAKLLEGHPHLDRLHVVPRKAWSRDLKRGRGLEVLGSFRRTIAELRRERYEVAFDFQSNFRSASITFLSRARRRIGQPAPFHKEGSHLLYTQRVPSVGAEVHKIERNLNLLRALGLEPQARPGVELRTTLPTGLPPKGERAWVALHPGVSKFGALKAWRPARFAELAAGLVAEGVEVFFTYGGAGERALAESLLTTAPGARLAPPLNLAEFAHFLTLVDLFVGVDSGPLHLAASVGAPVLGLYGPKHTGTYGPFWEGSRVVAADLPCSPCKHRRCPLPEASEVTLPSGERARISPCMDTITSERALRAALEQLGLPSG